MWVPGAEFRSSVRVISVFNRLAVSLALTLSSNLSNFENEIHRPKGCFKGAFIIDRKLKEERFVAESKQSSREGLCGLKKDGPHRLVYLTLAY